ncbi:MAG: LexA repressor [Pelotomaculum sp. PtaB.Bin104]|nr:MAG: LexA repressor [Pelotomaculum sp. PtaB.Bin104]
MPSIGSLIKKAREEKARATGSRYTQKMLARDIGMSQSLVGDIESGRTNPSYNTLNKIVIACGVPWDFFKTGDPPPGEDATDSIDNQYAVEDLWLSFYRKSYKLVPLVFTVKAGEPLLPKENIEDYIPTGAEFLKFKGGVYFYLRMRGDSMNQEFKEGNLLLVRKQSYIDNGQIAVIQINNCEAEVRKIYIKENLITLIPCSKNPKHQPVSYDMEKVEVSVIGRVTYAIKKY